MQGMHQLQNTSNAQFWWLFLWLFVLSLNKFFDTHEMLILMASYTTSTLDKTIISMNVHSSSKVFCGIHFRAISQ